MLQEIYSQGEAVAISFLAMEALMGLPKSALLAREGDEASASILEALKDMGDRLATGEPIQYVTGRAWFAGHAFAVGPGALIPRPETEELVELILKQNTKMPMRVLDACCGTGCIGLTLAARRKAWHVDLLDNSPDALHWAKQNQVEMGLTSYTTLLLDDVLAPSLSLPDYDLIVSNPPYVPQQELHTLAKNVADYEPHAALFVPDADPLLFYKALAEVGLQHLKPGGELWLEMHAPLAQQTAALFNQPAWEKVNVIKDFAGNKRFVVAKRHLG